MATVAARSGLKIRYETVEDGGDAKAILESSLAMLSLVQAVSADIDPDTRLEIRVQSPEPGSVILGFHVLPQVVEVGKLALGGSALGIVGRVLTTITKVVDLRKKLKGEPPEQVINHSPSNVVIIVNKSGQEIRTDIETYRAHENPEIASPIKAVFEPLAETDTVTRWNMLDLNDQPLASVEYEHFSGMATSASGDKDEAQYASQRITVPVIKPSFDKGLKWDISFFRERRSVRISDPEFLDSIDRGARFGKGDSLDVELRIKKVYDVRMGIFVAKEYEIVKVYNTIPSPTQSEIPFPERAIDPANGVNTTAIERPENQSAHQATEHRTATPSRQHHTASQ
ncbi:MAG: hypothetical protein ACLQVD_20480 [Capsulimonadaceae bacterium]